MELGRVNFLIVGAAKSATTWLQRALQEHPGVYMPDPELHYFSREYHRGHDWYLAQFRLPASDLLVGEKSNSYLDSDDAAERIRLAMPDVRLIAQLRNPVDRAYSDYCMLYRRGMVGSDIERHLDPRLDPAGRFLAGGHYARQLARFFERFPPDRMLVLLFDRMLADPTAQVARVHRFLALPPHWPGTASTRVKEKAAPMLHPSVRRYLGWTKPLLSPVWNMPALGKVRRLLVGEISYPALPPELRRRLVDHYAREIDDLGRLIGQDLTPWLRTTGAGVGDDDRPPSAP